jgi:hypothetical protein
MLKMVSKFMLSFETKNLLKIGWEVGLILCTFLTLVFLTSAFLIKGKLIGKKHQLGRYEKRLLKMSSFVMCFSPRTCFPDTRAG